MMAATICQDLKVLSGEGLLLERILFGEPARESIELELDRRAALKPIPIHRFRPAVSHAMRRSSRLAA